MGLLWGNLARDPPRHVVGKTSENEFFVVSTKKKWCWLYRAQPRPNALPGPVGAWSGVGRRGAVLFSPPCPRSWVVWSTFLWKGKKSRGGLRGRREGTPNSTAWHDRRTMRLPCEIRARASSGRDEHTWYCSTLQLMQAALHAGSWNRAVQRIQAKNGLIFFHSTTPQSGCMSWVPSPPQMT